MQLEWRTTDKNTIWGECDDCHNERPVKWMMMPEFKDLEFDEDDEYYIDFDECFQFYCFDCYKQAELEKDLKQ